jgi:RNA polymerase sigma factor (sigma-70 family)
MVPLQDEIRDAKAGDRRAFGRLVRRFQHVAIAYARGWLGDPESARDAAQDAFIDAYLHLDQLDQPAAFAGWLRRIVVKHCDRRSRKKKAPVEADPALVVDPASDPLVAREERVWLRRAIESLPDRERLVVALHYLGDEPQQEVADFLELPLSTVKKRLFSARRRLEERKGEMDGAISSRARNFATSIELFLAIRASDVPTTQALLEAHPELLEAEEAWSTELALDNDLPIAHRVTPLVLASGRGDRAMVELLLAKGAQPDATCGCVNGECALLAATLQGHVDVARILLEAGAAANAVNNVGHAPLHIAAMRRHDRLWSLLERYRGDPTLRAKNGMTPLDYRARPSRTTATTAGLVETGIKAIDLLAPIAPGMLVRVQGAAGTGLMVLLAEIARRLGDRGEHSLFVTWEPMPWQKGELAAFAKDVGIDTSTEVIVGGIDFDRATSRKPFALFVFQREGHTAELEATLPRLKELATVAFVVDPWAPVTRGDWLPAELRAPYDALICTSKRLAEEGIYPAIDPERSRSLAIVSERHQHVSQRLRTAALGSGELASRAKRFLTQPFLTWQHQNGRIGEVVPLVDAISGCEEVLQCS